MSHVHVKINFSFGIDSWNRCLSVHKRLQIRAQHLRTMQRRLCILLRNRGGGGGIAPLQLMQRRQRGEILVDILNRNFLHNGRPFVCFSF
jgi:hypothetical protein